MKKLILLLTVITLSYSCSNSDDSNSSNNNSNDFTGSYKGTVIDTINGSYWSTIYDYTIIIVPTNTNGQVSLTNNLILTNSATISGTTFTIPQTIAAQTATSQVVEWATGSFGGPNNNTLTVDFYQNNTNLTNGSVVSTVRSCILTKQ